MFSNSIQINIVGLGYIGLPTAIMMASNGVNVIGTDINTSLIEKLNSFQIPFVEKGLPDKFREAIEKGLRFSNKVEDASVYVIAVPTPFEESNKKINPNFVVKATTDVLNICKDNTIIVIESTVSPGTIDKYLRPLVHQKENDCGFNIHLAHAPERITPGNMLIELTNNNRTIGVDSPEIGEVLKNLYSSFCKGSITITDIRTAEMTKVVENTYRDINIAFANELAKICRIADLDVYEVIRVANMHPRVNILQPGPGVGGHCIHVDPWFLVGDYPGLANIILAARRINDSMPEYTLNRVYEIMKEHSMCDLSRIGIYGITYKEDVDDIRESPTLQLIDAMNRHLAPGIKCFDPYLKNKVVACQYMELHEFLAEVDLVIVMVAHQQIRENPDLLKGKVILDTKNIPGLTGSYKL